MFEIIVSQFSSSPYKSVAATCDVVLAFGDQHSVTIRQARVVRSHSGRVFFSLPNLKIWGDDGGSRYVPLIVLDKRLMSLVSERVLTAFENQSKDGQLVGGAR